MYPFGTVSRCTYNIFPPLSFGLCPAVHYVAEIFGSALGLELTREARKRLRTNIAMDEIIYVYIVMSSPITRS